MKAYFPFGKSVAAFTLTEMMISMTVFIIVVTGVVTSHVIGVRMYEITQAKLGAGDQARLVLNKLTEDVKGSKRVQVGTSYSEGLFEEAVAGQLQKGNSILVYPTTNYTSFIQYRLDSYSGELRRIPLDGTSVEVIAEHIRNVEVFTSEDHHGNVLTDNQNNRVVGLLMQFEQIQYPVTAIGHNKPIEFYQFRTRVTRRVLE